MLHFTGGTFKFFVSKNDVEIYHITDKIGDKKLICKVTETGAMCQKDVWERTALHQGYLSLKDLTKNDEGVYKIVYIKDNTDKEIVLEVWQLDSKGKFKIFSE